MLAHYVWIPSNQNEKPAFVSNSLLDSIKAVASTEMYSLNNLPRGRVMFVGPLLQDRVFIDETTLFNTVNNSNLTAMGLEGFLRNHGFDHYISHVRFPSKGYLVHMPIPSNAVNQNFLWFHVNTMSIRNAFSDTISLVDNLSTSIYNRSRTRDTFTIVEDGHVTSQTVNLIVDEIPSSLRYIEQSGSQWHKAVLLNGHSNKQHLSMRLADYKIMSALTDPVTLRYLAMNYTTFLLKGHNHNEAITNVTNLKDEFEEDSATNRQTRYTNLYNSLLKNHRNSFEFIGFLHFVNTEEIHVTSGTNVLVL